MTLAQTTAMYKAIHSQPQEWRRLATEAQADADRAAELLVTAERVFLVGTGTSYHAAQAGEYLLRSVGVDAWAVPAFAFAGYPRPLSPRDAVIVISHRGTKQYSLRALDLAIDRGARTLAVTGQDAPLPPAELVLATVAQERSSAHTVSFSGSLAALVLLAIALGRRRGRDVQELASAIDAMPAALDDVLRREGEIQSLARQIAAGCRLGFVGGGPNLAIAAEGALKVKETSYMVAEGFDVEALLHGPFIAFGEGDLLTLINPGGATNERMMQIATGSADIGVRTWCVGTALSVAAVETFAVPQLPEPLSPAALVVPLQLLAIYLAEERGTDPDGFRLAEPRYRLANSRWTL